MLAFAVALAVAAPASAQTVTVGADLNRPANAQITCSNNPSPPFLGVLAVPPPFNESCTWTNSGSISDPREGFLVPEGTGRVTNVRVKVGPVTAPMQVAILQAYRGSVTGCCTGIRMSQVFTPAPNGVTQVAVNLPTETSIVNSSDGNPTAVFQLIGLSVLASNVPIPAHDLGQHSVDNLQLPANYACFPALRQPEQQCVTQTNGIASNGFVVLMQADWERGAGGPPPPPQAPPAVGGQPPAVAQQQVGAAQPPRFVLARRVGPVRGGAAVFSIECGAGAPCAGTLRLVPAGARAAQRRAARAYATAPVNIAPGAKKAVRLRLNAAGRKALRRRRSLRLRMELVQGTAVQSLGTVTLRRPR